MNIKPMGAYKIDDYSHKIIYPALSQPKLDGFRCVARYDLNENKVILSSRSGKEFNHLDKIKEQLKIIYENLDKKYDKSQFYFDGELYCKNFTFSQLSGIIRTKYLNKNKEKLQNEIVYNIFDCFYLPDLEKLSFENRYKIIKNILSKNISKNKLFNISLVITKEVKSSQDVDKQYLHYIKEGYEGIIIRNKKGLYKIGGSRSLDVFRSKEFKQGIFKIVGYKEGQGEEKGTPIWELECQVDKSKYFSAKPIGSRAFRKKQFKNADLLVGKFAKVKYIDLDNLTGCISRNPVVEEIY
jgi:ATP-dependent DNA ligase